MSAAPAELVDELAGLDFDHAWRCEHASHGGATQTARRMHADGGEALCRIACTDGPCVTPEVRCAAFIGWLTGGGTVFCPECGSTFGIEAYTLLGTQ